METDFERLADDGDDLFREVEPGSDGRRITRVKVQENDDSRVSVFINGEFAFGCHQDLVLKHGLQKGQRLTVEQQQEVEVDDQVIRAKKRAFDYLAHKPRTETEVRRKLRELDLNPAVIDRVIARLVELDYLDDEEYAHEYASNRFANRGYGPVRIERELRERGVDRAIAERAVAEFFEEESELEAAREQAEKRWPRVSKEEDVRKQKRKLFGYLQRRGFTTDTVYQVVDEFVDGNE